MSEDLMFEESRRRISRASKLVLVASGKGGVGKSLISASLALSLGELGKKVGILDLDVHGPSIPNIFGVKGEVLATKFGLNPIRVSGVELMSIGLIVKDSPIPLKGEYKRSLISTLTALTNWSRLDYLIVDLPPGTGDETIWSIRILKGASKGGAIIVTLPSMLSTSVVRRAIQLLRGEGVKLLGIVENMSFFRCNDDIVRPFGSLSDDLAEDLIARIPIEPSVEEAMLKGIPVNRASPEIHEVFLSLARKIDNSLR